MNKLYIDDIRDPKVEGFVVVRNYRYAVRYMEIHGCPDFISFDHDLGNAKAETGFDVAKWMVERDMDAGGHFIPQDFKFFVHSANPVGVKNIEGLLNNYLEKRDVNENI